MFQVLLSRRIAFDANACKLKLTSSRFRFADRLSRDAATIETASTCKHANERARVLCRRELDERNACAKTQSNSERCYFWLKGWNRLRLTERALFNLGGAVQADTNEIKTRLAYLLRFAHFYSRELTRSAELTDRPARRGLFRRLLYDSLDVTVTRSGLCK